MRRPCVCVVDLGFESRRWSPDLRAPLAIVIQLYNKSFPIEFVGGVRHIEFIPPSRPRLKPQLCICI